MPETVRLTKERMLKCLATELEEKQQESRDKKMNKKYRMVKFFGMSTDIGFRHHIVAHMTFLSSPVL